LFANGWESEGDLGKPETHGKWQTDNQRRNRKKDEIAANVGERETSAKRALRVLKISGVT